MIQLVLETEHELEAVLFGVRVPMRPIPVTSIIRLVLNLSGGNTKSDSFIGLRRDLLVRELNRGYFWIKLRTMRYW